MKLSIIIPAYNEEKRLPKTLLSIDKHLKGQSYEYEIIVVSDGSKDDTAKMANDLKPNVSGLKVIDNKENHGKGYVVRQGMLEARGDYRIFSDADNSTTIDQVERMWPWFEKGYDIVIGSRDVEGSVLNPPQPWLRKVIFGGGFKLVRKFIIGLWNINDTQCGFKCFTKKAAEDIFSSSKIDGFAFDVEILVLAKRMKHKIKEIPITWINDVESKVKLKHVFKMFLEMLKLRKDLVFGKYGKRRI